MRATAEPICGLSLVLRILCCYCREGLGSCGNCLVKTCFYHAASIPDVLGICSLPVDLHCNGLGGGGGGGNPFS